MNIQRPLTNPVARDIRQPLPVEQQSNLPTYNTNSQKTHEQLEMNINSREDSAKQFIGGVKTMVRKKLDILEINPIWKDPSLPFMMISFFFNIVLLFVGGLIFYNKLPPTLQLFYDIVEGTWQSQEKYWHVIIIPIFLFVIMFLQYRFLKFTFIHDKRLSITVSWLMTLLNVMLMIAIAQIYSLNPIL